MKDEELLEQIEQNEQDDQRELLRPAKLSDWHRSTLQVLVMSPGWGLQSEVEAVKAALKHIDELSVENERLQKKTESEERRSDSLDEAYFACLTRCNVAEASRATAEGLLTKVRDALEEAERRFRAREHGGVIYGAFYNAVQALFTSAQPAESKEKGKNNG